MSLDEERAGEALRTLMREADLPPSGSDVELARRAGRSQAVRRRVLGAGAAAVLVAGTASVSAVILTRDDSVELVADDRAVSCQLTETLPIPKGYTTGWVAGTDRSGRYRVGTVQVSQELQGDPVLWNDGVAMLLPLPGQDPEAVGVNSRADVIGRDLAAGAKAAAWLYRDGVFHSLPAPKGFQEPTPWAINDRGDVVGAASDGGGRSYAVVWPADTPNQPRRLDAPEGAIADGIGEDGTVVGTAGLKRTKTGQLGAGQPYLWNLKGTARKLDVPAGWEGGSAVSISDGWVLGTVQRSVPSNDPPGGVEQETAPVRWRLRGGAAQILAEPSNVVDVIGASGWFSAMTVPTGWSETVLINMDGRIRRGLKPTADPTRTGPKGEAIPVPVIGESPVWVRENGHELTVLANGSPEEKGPRPGIWRCQV